MWRAGLIAAVAVGIVVIAGVAAWFVAFRDTAEPVTVNEAVTSFRTDTEPTSPRPSPIPEGVYVYATSGFEETDALTGVMHRYPRRSTITVAAHECGVVLTWRALKGRSTEWVYCDVADGWKLRSQDERHTFFGRTERTTYVCADALIRPAKKLTWTISCSTGSIEETGRGELVGHERLEIGGAEVQTEHVGKRTTFSGEVRGTARYDLWFDTSSGIPVKLLLVSRTTNDSPIGEVRYDEEVTLRLLSLEPRR